MRAGGKAKERPIHGQSPGKASGQEGFAEGLAAGSGGVEDVHVELALEDVGQQTEVDRAPGAVEHARDVVQQVVVRRDVDETPQLILVFDLVADELVAALGFGRALVLQRELRRIGASLRDRQGGARLGFLAAICT